MLRLTWLLVGVSIAAMGFAQERAQEPAKEQDDDVKLTQFKDLEVSVPKKDETYKNYTEMLAKYFLACGKLKNQMMQPVWSSIVTPSNEERTGMPIELPSQQNGYVWKHRYFELADGSNYKCYVYTMDILLDLEEVIVYPFHMNQANGKNPKEICDMLKPLLKKEDQEEVQREVVQKEVKNETKRALVATKPISIVSPVKGTVYRNVKKFVAAGDISDGGQPVRGKLIAANKPGQMIIGKTIHQGPHWRIEFELPKDACGDHTLIVKSWNDQYSGQRKFRVDN